MVKSYGVSGDYNILVMEFLGKSLEDIFSSLEVKKMSVECVCNIGVQMIDVLKLIHDKHIVHRDIKPDNFVTGIEDKENTIYLLDFGLAKKYRAIKDLHHYPMVNKKKLTGTARYASINALKGYEQSRRDDLEAVGYVLMYFLRGSLPWQGLPVKNREDRYAKIMEKKRDTTPEQLCKGFPKEFEDYVTYTRGMEYEQDPDYDYLKGLFQSAIKGVHGYLDKCFDWTSEERKRKLREAYLQEHSNGNYEDEPINQKVQEITRQNHQSNCQVTKKEDYNDNNHLQANFRSKRKSYDARSPASDRNNSKLSEDRKGRIGYDEIQAKPLDNEINEPRSYERRIPTDNGKYENKMTDDNRDFSDNMNTNVDKIEAKNDENVINKQSEGNIPSSGRNRGKRAEVGDNNPTSEKNRKRREQKDENKCCRIY